MKVLGVARARIDKLKLPGNWREICADPMTARIAKSFEQVFQLHEPIVRKKDGLLIAGRRRTAAHHVRGDTELLCKFVECTDDEAWLIERHENAERVHDVGLQARITQELLTRFEGANGETMPKARSGRAQTAKGAARAQTAELLGVEPETVRKREQRAKKAAAVAEPETPPEPALRNPWVTLDDPEFDRKAREVQEAIDRAAVKANGILSELTALAESGLPVHAERIGRVYADLREAFERLRGLRPSTLCPWCKGVAALLPNCVACLGTQYIVKSQEGGVPKALESEENPVVMANGEMRPLFDFFDSGGVDPETDDAMVDAPSAERDPAGSLPLAEAGPFGDLPE